MSRQYVALLSKAQVEAILSCPGPEFKGHEGVLNFTEATPFDLFLVEKRAEGMHDRAICNAWDQKIKKVEKERELLRKLDELRNPG